MSAPAVDSAPAAPAPPPAAAWLVRLGNALFRTRDAVFPLVLLGLVALTRPRWPNGSERLDDALDALGVLVALAGQALRAATVGYAYIIRGGKDRRVYAEELVTRGLFRHGRNPLYVGNLLILAGLFLVWNNPATYLLGGAFFLVAYVAIVEAEEAFLQRKFGPPYDAYRARVPRWTLRVRGLRGSLAELSFNWRRVVLKEYGSAAYWVAGICVLQLADSLRYRPWGAREAYHTALVAGVGATVALWALARWLKKSQRLTESGPTGGRA